MYIPNDPTRYTDSSPGPRNQLFNNPMTCDIIMLITVASFAILLVTLVRSLQSCIAPEDDADADADDHHHYQDQQEPPPCEEKPAPLDPTPTVDDGTPIDNESGGEYISVHIEDAVKWFNCDALEGRLRPLASDDDWIDVVYYPATRTLGPRPGARSNP